MCKLCIYYSRGKDFTIMFNDGKTSNPSVFYLLEQACLQLCRISFYSRQKAYTSRRPPTPDLHERFVYNMMMWGKSKYFLLFPTSYITLCAVSLSLKVRSHRGTVTRSLLKPWKDHLTSRSHLLSMNESQIDCLKAGLKFGKAIALPKEFKFNSELMRDMVIPPDPTSTTVRYFSHLK